MVPILGKEHVVQDIWDDVFCAIFSVFHFFRYCFGGCYILGWKNNMMGKQEGWYQEYFPEDVASAIW